MRLAKPITNKLRGLSVRLYQPVDLRFLVITGWLFAGFYCLLPHASSANDLGRELALSARTILEKRCFQCHGKNGVASKNIFVLDRNRMVSDKTVLPNNAESKLLKMVENNSMPLGGPPLPEQERVILRAWILSGAPDWQANNEPQISATPIDDRPTVRRRLTETTITDLIEQDLEKAPERSRPYLRYFSIAHLFNAGVGETELAEYRIGLSKLINSLSWHREITTPKPIDSAQTIMRIDLRDYNWTSTHWRRLLACYPYGIKVSGNESICRISGAEIPYLRADWFVANAATPPLYHDLLGLPTTVEHLERMLGVDAERNIREERNLVRAAIRNSGVSQNNRVVERHSSLYGAYWKSYDFSNSQGEQNIFMNPISFKPAGGEMIFNLPNGMQGYFISDAHGRRLDAAPIQIVSDRNHADEPVVRNGRSCMSCHFAGMKTFKDDLRAVLKSEQSGALKLDARYQALQEKALALYPEQEVIDRLIQEDQVRFRQAIEKSGGRLSENFQTEPIDSLSRRFNAELNLPLACAESGLDIDEFQARLKGSSKLSTLGYNQLLVANAGFKRDTWEKNFCELVREMHLGEFIAGNQLAINTISNIANNGAINVAANNAVTTTTTTTNNYAANHQASTNIAFKSGQKFIIHSKSNFFKSSFVETALLETEPFRTQQLLIVQDWNKADILIELDRPVFTFNFVYKIWDRNTSVLLASGKVTAGDDKAAAPKIVKDIVTKLSQMRSLSH